jgi:hypothetical protein
MLPYLIFDGILKSQEVRISTLYYNHIIKISDSAYQFLLPVVKKTGNGTCRASTFNYSHVHLQHKCTTALVSTGASFLDEMKCYTALFFNKITI